MQFLYFGHRAKLHSLYSLTTYLRLLLTAADADITCRYAQTQLESWNKINEAHGFKNESYLFEKKIQTNYQLCQESI